MKSGAPRVDQAPPGGERGEGEGEEGREEEGMGGEGGMGEELNLVRFTVDMTLCNIILHEPGFAGSGLHCINISCMHKLQTYCNTTYGNS